MKTIPALIAAAFIASQAHLHAAADSLQYSQRSGAVGYVALIKPGEEKNLATTAAGLDEKLQIQLGKHGIIGLHLFTEVIGKDRVILAAHDIKEDSAPDANWEAAAKDPEIKPWIEKLQACLLPHPRNKDNGRIWTRCETVNQLHPRVPDRPRGEKPEWQAAVTGLKLEKEAEYRSLHAAVWPGVIDAIGNSMISRFDVFLVEFGEQPYLFYQLEYLGKDLKADGAAQSTNPVNQRWWKWTDACQQPLPSAAARKEMWEPMEAASTLE